MYKLWIFCIFYLYLDKFMLTSTYGHFSIGIFFVICVELLKVFLKMYDYKHHFFFCMVTLPFVMCIYSLSIWDQVIDSLILLLCMLAQNRCLNMDVCCCSSESILTKQVLSWLNTLNHQSSANNKLNPIYISLQQQSSS